MIGFKLNKKLMNDYILLLKLKINDVYVLIVDDIFHVHYD